LQEQLTD